MSSMDNFRLALSSPGLSGLDSKIVLTYDNTRFTDGAGAQLQRIYVIYSISRLLGVPYLHSPLGRVEYQGLSALESNMASPGYHHELDDLFQIKSDVLPRDDFHKIKLTDISMDILRQARHPIRYTSDGGGSQISYSLRCRTELPTIFPIATKSARRYRRSRHLWATAARYGSLSTFVGESYSY
jgi:hypothetical protein